MSDAIATALWWLGVSSSRVEHFLRQELLAAKLLVHVVTRYQRLEIREELLITQTWRYLQFIHDLDTSQLILVGV